MHPRLAAVVIEGFVGKIDPDGGLTAYPLASGTETSKSWTQSATSDDVWCIMLNWLFIPFSQSLRFCDQFYVITILVVVDVSVMCGEGLHKIERTIASE
jgi:hypothetical protein